RPPARHGLQLLVGHVEHRLRHRGPGRRARRALPALPPRPAVRAAGHALGRPPLRRRRHVRRLVLRLRHRPRLPALRPALPAGRRVGGAAPPARGLGRPRPPCPQLRPRRGPLVRGPLVERRRRAGDVLGQRLRGPVAHALPAARPAGGAARPLAGGALQPQPQGLAGGDGRGVPPRLSRGAGRPPPGAADPRRTGAQRSQPARSTSVGGPPSPTAWIEVHSPVADRPDSATSIVPSPFRSASAAIWMRSSRSPVPWTTDEASTSVATPSPTTRRRKTTDQSPTCGDRPSGSVTCSAATRTSRVPSPSRSVRSSWVTVTGVDAPRRVATSAAACW